MDCWPKHTDDAEMMPLKHLLLNNTRTTRPHSRRRPRLGSSNTQSRWFAHAKMGWTSKKLFFLFSFLYLSFSYISIMEPGLGIRMEVLGASGGWMGIERFGWLSPPSFPLSPSLCWSSLFLLHYCVCPTACSYTILTCVPTIEEWKEGNKTRHLHCPRILW